MFLNESMIHDPNGPNPEKREAAAPDSVLLRRYAEQRDEAAFAAVVARHIDLVYAAALRRTGGDAHRARDVAQQVFIGVARNAATLALHAALTGWLYTTTRNAAFNLMRDEIRRREYEAAAQSAALLHHAPAHDEAWARLRPTLDQAMDELGAADREAVLWRYFEGKPLAEIGRRLRVSESAARMRADRALDRLRAVLVQRGLTSTTTALAAVLSANAAGAAPAGLAAAVSTTALAHAGGVVAPAAWLTLMNLTKAKTGLGVLAALVLGLAVHEQFALREAQARHATASADLASLQQSVDAWERARPSAPVPPTTNLPTAPASAANAGTATTAATTAQAGDDALEPLRDTFRRRWALDRSNPEYQQLGIDLRKREVSRTYGALYRQLGLPSEKIARFEAAMAERDVAANDLIAAARAQRLAFDDPVVRSLDREAQVKLETALHALFDSAEYDRYTRYSQTTQLRTEITEWMAAALQPTATPLTGVQAEDLTNLLARHSPLDREGRRNPSELEWPALLAEARSLLATAQWEMLAGVESQQTWRRSFSQAIGQIDAPAPAAKPTAR